MSTDEKKKEKLEGGQPLEQKIHLIQMSYRKAVEG